MRRTGERYSQLSYSVVRVAYGPVGGKVKDAPCGRRPVRMPGLILRLLHAHLKEIHTDGLVRLLTGQG
jgi:hypothetical protein